jgi:dihydroorotase
VTADVSINSLHLTDATSASSTAARASRRRCASSATATRCAPRWRRHHRRAGVRPHPVDEDAKTLPFAEAEPGATGLELLLSLALKWAQDDSVPLQRALAVVTSAPAAVLGTALGTLQASVGRWSRAAWATCASFDPGACGRAPPRCAARASTRRSRATSCQAGACHAGGRTGGLERE